MLQLVVDAPSTQRQLKPVNVEDAQRMSDTLQLVVAAPYTQPTATVNVEIAQRMSDMLQLVVTIPTLNATETRQG